MNDQDKVGSGFAYDKELHFLDVVFTDVEERFEKAFIAEEAAKRRVLGE